MNLMKFRNRLETLLMSEANAGEGSAAAGGTAAAAGAGQGGADAGSTAAAQGSAAQAGAPAATSTLAAGLDPAAGTGTPQAINEVIAEKFRVTKEDGSFDLEASTRKLAASYGELEKMKGGKTGAAPETPEGYEPKVEIEGFVWDDFKADPKMKGFLKGAHARGMSNDDLSWALSEYVAATQEIAAGTKLLTMDECQAALAEHWKTESERKAGISAAGKVTSALLSKAGLTFKQLEESGLADNPTFIRLLAPFAEELREDTIPPSAGTPGAGNIDELLNSDAYKNPSHADHQKVSEQVRKHYEKVHGSAPAL